MSEQERKLRERELDIPAASGAAFADAFQQAIASGQSVLQAENGKIYEVFPDGRRRFIKQIQQPTAVEPGTKVKIR